jgi:hypothetical protein
MWVGSGDAAKKLRLSDGAILDTVPFHLNQVAGLAFDGFNMWTAVRTINTVVKLPN